MAVSYVFCDESHVDSHTFRVQGGIWVPEIGMRPVSEAFKTLRAKHPSIQELKWSYVTGKTALTVYKDLVDLFFASDVRRYLSFKCMVIRRTDDVSQLADKTGKDLGFFKAYYTFLF